MKLVTPANDWKNVILVDDEHKEFAIDLLGDVAKKLNLPFTYDDKNNKLYIDKPRNVIQKIVSSVVNTVKKVFTKQDKYRIEFKMPLPENPVDHLVEGYLILYCNDVESLRIRASSGVTRHQYKNHYWTIGKSPMPPSSEIVGSYQYATFWYKPGNVSACGSRFYPIKPDPIINKYNKKQKRSEIGDHYDENNVVSPGSAGCNVGLPRKSTEEKGWNDWKAALDEINKLGINWIPAEVIYN